MSSKSRATILQPTPENIARVAQALNEGAVAGMPTETVYGLAGHALDPQALAQIFSVKERPTFDPLIVHIAETQNAKTLNSLESQGLVNVKALSPLARSRAQLLMEKFWPGPLTLVLPKQERVPDLATAGLPSVAIRMPRHLVAQALLREAKIPLAAPSANRFGRISPTRAAHVFEELGDRIDWILDGGSCEIGVESTVISVSANGEISLLRPGGISKQEIEALLQSSIHEGVSGEKQGAAIAQGKVAALAPGMLESHYAPEKPLYLLSKALSQTADSNDPALNNALQKNPKKIGFLLMSGDPKKSEQHLSKRFGIQVIVRSLSNDGNLAEAAQNLFSALRELDHSDADVLIAEPCTSSEGLGHAISDRIRRASAKRV